MTPRTRVLRDTQMSLHRQQRELDERHRRDSDRLMAAEEDLVIRFRSAMTLCPLRLDLNCGNKQTKPSRLLGRHVKATFPPPKQVEPETLKQASCKMIKVYRSPLQVPC